MIRREITSPEGTSRWLLISQVEHARVSGELAAAWGDDVSPDVVDAIAHHDDGWRAWEADPKLNPEFGAPFSFLEMPPAAAMVIWDHSIESAERFGPLAAYMVAGHFYSLLDSSDNAQDQLAHAWLAAKRKLRTSWLDQWMRTNSANTLAYARQSLELLQRLDVMSLWLCCDCPFGGAAETVLQDSSMQGRMDELLQDYRLTVSDFEPSHGQSSPIANAYQWHIRLAKYPFRESPISVGLRAMTAPRRVYSTWNELKSASRPVDLRWTLTGETSPRGN